MGRVIHTKNVFPGILLENIFGKINKLSEIRPDKKTLIYVFA